MSIGNELQLQQPIRSVREEALLNIYYTAALRAKLAHVLYRPDGLTDLQFNVLNLLKYEGGDKGLSRPKLSSLIYVHPTNVTRIVKRMETVGLIRRVDGHSDERARVVCMTAAGEGRHKKAQRIYLFSLRDSVRGLHNAEMDELVGMLGRVRVRIREMCGGKVRKRRLLPRVSLTDEVGLKYPIEARSERTILSVYYTASVIRTAMHGLFRPHGLSGVQFNVLHLLEYQSTSKGLSQRQLSSMMMIDPATTAPLIDRMEKTDLVKRMSVRGDKRQYSIVMTPAGEERHRHAEKDYCSRIVGSMDCLQDPELRELMRVLELIRERIREQRFALDGKRL